MQLAVKFYMCEGSSKCKSHEEIRQWLSGKYIALLYNHRRFLTPIIDGKNVLEEARIEYVPISSQTRQLTPY